MVRGNGKNRESSVVANRLLSAHKYTTYCFTMHQRQLTWMLLILRGLEVYRFICMKLEPDVPSFSFQPFTVDLLFVIMSGVV
jgi:hypothetical protein